MTRRETQMPFMRQQPTSNLFRIEELEDENRTRKLADSDLDALRAVADWIKTFVAGPHKDLGRTGPVCPFVPGALEQHTLWLAPEQIADRTGPDVVELIRRYQRLFKEIQPTDQESAIYKSFVVIFTDLLEDCSRAFFDDLLESLAGLSYATDGFVMGGFYEGNEGTAIYNASFHPFLSPVPFLLVRQAVISDWKFFLDNEDQLNLWARRYGDSGVRALAEELRRSPWRAGH
jgi:Domain of unknown function (DUF6875)